MIDYRKYEQRRAVFIDFYKFHLENRAHAGAVYYAFPYIFDKLGMTDEQKLWFVFINGCSQNVVTTYLIYKNFPNLAELKLEELSSYFRSNYERFGWDTDRRYVKNKFEDCIKSYIKNLNGKTQVQFFNDLIVGDKFANFRSVWDKVITNFEYFGRLSTFSYLEYLRIAGIDIDCDSLFLDDIGGSKSHRNGLCKVIGRDDLDWSNDNEDVIYTKEMIGWLEKEAETLMKECSEKINHHDVSYFTLETTLCCYKGWHRVNRRYPNVYNDMFYERIRKSENMWKEEDFSIFWESRQKYLSKELRLEDNLLDKGLSKEKQNHYRLTGEVIMMENEGYELKTKTWLKNCILITGCCGVGKTWVMNQLLNNNKNKTYAIGKFCFHETNDMIVIGKYDNSIFQGSDKLSMSVITDLDKMLKYINKSGKLAVFEGDRFTNSRFIQEANPVIIRIKGDGEEGRMKRKSKQTERHLKSITTRVSNIQSHKDVDNSTECLELIKKLNNEYVENRTK